MDRRRRVRVSKLLSLVLRHDPGKAGVELDAAGWTDVDDLLGGLAAIGTPLDRDDLATVMAEGDKPRFELSDDGRRIRARYGHSVDVRPGYDPVAPPEVLYHGTAARNVARILDGGIAPMRRRLVHLSADAESARQVGTRHGRPVVLEVEAARLAADGAEFFQLPGGIWLTAAVPADYVLNPASPRNR